jgi:hydrogenase expression/formation protein HypC
MCLAIPGRVVEWLDGAPPFRQATIEFGETRRAVSMECVPEAVTGDYVLVHAGIAISRIDAEEAQRVMELLEELELSEAPESIDTGSVESLPNTLPQPLDTTDSKTDDPS